jgi:hypothetical protein
MNKRFSHYLRPIIVFLNDRQLIYYSLPKLKGGPYKITFFVMDTSKNNECILFLLGLQDTWQYTLPGASLL